jgi:hypothetical protein
MGCNRTPFRQPIMMFKTNFHRPTVFAGLLALFLPAASVAQGDAMKFHLTAAQKCRDACAAEISAEGMITLESVDAFRAIAATLASTPIIVRLASPGGNLVGSLQLGQAFREFNATVIVGKGARCVSACVYAFLGGAARRVIDGRIGVHRFRPEGEDSDRDFPTVLVQRATAVLTEYVTHMGADPELIKLAMGISPPAVHFLDAGELRRYRVVN